jgi:hypothetical protein
MCCFMYYLLSICYLFAVKEEWVMLIGWCLLLCHEFSSMPLGTRRLGTPGLDYIALKCVVE